MENIARNLNIPEKEVENIVKKYHIEDVTDINDFQDAKSLENLDQMLNAKYQLESRYQFDRMISNKYKHNLNDPEFPELVLDSQLKEINEIVAERGIPNDIIEKIMVENPEFFHSPLNYNMREIFIRLLESVQSVEEIPNLLKITTEVLKEAQQSSEAYSDLVTEMKKKHFDLEEFEVEVQEPSVEEVQYEMGKDVTSEMPDLPDLPESHQTNIAFPGAIVAGILAPVVIGVGALAVKQISDNYYNKKRKEAKNIF